MREKIKVKKNNYFLLIILAVTYFILAKFIFKGKDFIMLCFINLGSLTLFFSLRHIINSFVITKAENEDALRKKEIEMNDERNIRIREKAGSKINQLVIYLLNILIWILSFMDVNFIVILMVVFILIIEWVLFIILTKHYSKMM